MSVIIITTVNLTSDSLFSSFQPGPAFARYDTVGEAAQRAPVSPRPSAKAAFVLCGESRVLASLGRVELASCPSRGGLEGNRNLLSPGGELPGPEEDDVGKLEQSLPGSAADVRG